MGFNPQPNSSVTFYNVAGLAVQPDGKILVGGLFTTVGGVTRNHIARINPDGSLDSGFNPDAGGATSWAVEAILVQSDGKVIIGGSFNTIGATTRSRIARLYADGALDLSFNPNANGTVTSLAEQPDGKLIIAGSFTTVDGLARSRIARLNTDGTVDPSFNASVNSYVRSASLQADGKILIGGGFTTVGGVTRNWLARLNSTGTLDAGFNPAPSAPVYCTRELSDGKILIAGQFGFVNGLAQQRIARLNPDGTLDAGFSFTITNSIYTTSVQADGRVLVGGLSPVNGVAGTTLARLNSDGTLDSSFNPYIYGEPPLVPWVYGLALQDDGRILAGGDFTSVGGVYRNFMARLDNDAATQRLTVSSLDRVEWLRGGASPETLRVNFELSTDGGVTWSALGAGTRTLGGWELTGLSLPASGLVRARARITGGSYNGSSWIVESVASIGETKARQTISFGYLDAKYLGITPSPLAVTASSGLPVSFSSSNPGVATVNGNMITLVSAGTTIITAYQAGDATYLAATPVSRTLVVNPPPVAPGISVQPPNQVGIEGSNVTLTVVATGTSPLAYRWRFNGTNLSNDGRISGVTTAALTLAGAANRDWGSYDVIVTNLAGSVTSTSVMLTVAVAPSPSITLPLPGRNLVKLLADKLRPKVYGLNFGDGTNVGTLLAFDSTNGTTLAEISLGVKPTDMSATAVGDMLYVINTGSRSLMKVDLATFAVTATRPITTPNTYDPANPLHLAAGRSNLVYFTDGGWSPGIYSYDFDPGTVLGVFDDDNGVGGLAATRDGNTLFAWRQYGWGAGNVNSWVTRLNSQGITPVPLETSFVSWRRDPFDTPVLLDVQENLVFNKQQMFSAANVSILLKQFAQNIYAIAGSGEGAFGSNAVFNAATGSQITNLPISTVVQAVTADDRNLFLYRTAPSQIIVHPLDMMLSAGWQGSHLPFITTQPSSQAVLAGTNATFRTSLLGSSPAAYQWRFNGVPLVNGGRVSGATSAIVTVTGVVTNDAGSYDVVVTNAVGSVTSSNAVLTVNVPPVITSQPSSSTSVVGQLVTFTVNVTGTVPLVYQWRFNGVPLGNNFFYSGVSTATLTVRVTLGGLGNYDVVVSNAGGSVTSSNAVLSINTPPSITSQPAGQPVLVGSNVIFNVTVAGTAPLIYQWRFNGTNLTDGGRISGAASSALMLSSVVTNDSGGYDVVVTNVAGSVTSSNAVLTVSAVPVAPSITTQPTNQTVLAGTNVMLAVIADGTGPLIYQWCSNGVALASATNTTLDFVNVQTNATAAYSVVITNSVGSVTSSVVALTVNALPVITTQPAGQSVVAGSNVTFTVVAGGTMPLNYQWRFNGTNLAEGGRVTGTTGSTLTVANLVTNDAGNYDVVVTNVAGSLTSSNAVLVVNAPPVITTQPVSQSVVAGNNVTFTVAADGVPPPALSWFKDGTRLTNSAGVSGATAATLLVFVTGTNQAGGYAAVATNAAGSTTSSVVALTVLLPPTITTHPSNVFLLRTNLGSVLPAGFTVVASGTGSLLYQWRFNGTDLPGATNPAFNLGNVTRADNGPYTVLVSNAVGTALSSNALLRVRVPQRLPWPERLPDGRMRLLFLDDLGGIPGSNDLSYLEVQFATNLLTSNIVWSRLTNAVTVTNGMLVVEEPAGLPSPRRFYRVIER